MSLLAKGAVVGSGIDATAMAVGGEVGVGDSAGVMVTVAVASTAAVGDGKGRSVGDGVGMGDGSAAAVGEGWGGSVGDGVSVGEAAGGRAVGVVVGRGSDGCWSVVEPQPVKTNANRSKLYTISRL